MLWEAWWPYLAAFALGMGAGAISGIQLERRRIRGGQLDLSGKGVHKELRMVKDARMRSTEGGE